MLDRTFHFHAPVTINFGCACQPKKPKTIRFAVVGLSVESKPRRKESAMLNVQIRTNQFARVNLSPVDADGKAVVIENLAVAVQSGDAVATVVDGKIQIVPSDVPGVSVIEVDADGQPGELVEVITETITLTTIAPNAVTLGAVVEVGQKSDLPPAAPAAGE